MRLHVSEHVCAMMTDCEFRARHAQEKPEKRKYVCSKLGAISISKGADRTEAVAVLNGKRTAGEK